MEGAKPSRGCRRRPLQQAAHPARPPPPAPLPLRSYASIPFMPDVVAIVYHILRLEGLLAEGGSIIFASNPLGLDDQAAA